MSHHNEVFCNTISLNQNLSRFSHFHFQMRSNFHETFMFLTKLMWKNRIILPAMISVFYLVSNFRWEIEISIQTERIERIHMPNDNDDNESDNNSYDYSSNDEYELASTTDEDDSEDMSVIVRH